MDPVSGAALNNNGGLGPRHWCANGITGDLQRFSDGADLQVGRARWSDPLSRYAERPHGEQRTAAYDAQRAKCRIPGHRTVLGIGMAQVSGSACGWPRQATHTMPTQSALRGLPGAVRLSPPGLAQWLARRPTRLYSRAPATPRHK